VKWLIFVKMLYMILSCELKAFHAHLLLKWLYINLCSGLMLFSFRVKDPFVIMNG
jgi:hypothetical protein